MKDPLSTLPDRITSYVDLAVASQRLQRFLARDEVVPHRQSAGSGGSQQESTDAIVLRGSFSWGVSTAAEERASASTGAKGDGPTQHLSKNKAPDTAAQRKHQNGRGYTRLDQEDDDELAHTVDDAVATGVQAPLLRGVSLRVRHGDLVMIIGTVGSGKSNLLSAVLGEMTPSADHDDATCAVVNGQVAYMGQTAWILNMTLRDNVVISGQQDPVDEERYQEALRVSGLSHSDPLLCLSFSLNSLSVSLSLCLSVSLSLCLSGLLEDLAALPARDRTEIGARGINISGGQKARVCLARLVYRYSLSVSVSLCLSLPLSLSLSLVLSLSMSLFVSLCLSMSLSDSLVYSEATICLLDDPTAALDSTMSALSDFL